MGVSPPVDAKLGIIKKELFFVLVGQPRVINYLLLITTNATGGQRLLFYSRTKPYRKCVRAKS